MLNLSVEEIGLFVIAGLFVLCLASIILLIITLCKLKKLRRRVDALTRGKDAETMEDTILKYFEKIEALENEKKEIQESLKSVKENLKMTYQKTALVKYDAFREMSGALSYALVLLDKEDNGILINSMYSREGCYSYAKDIVHGKCELNLSEEEKEALKQAVEK